MNKIRTLIVDDEPLAREGLELLVRRDPEVELVGLAHDGRVALEMIRQEKPDLVFLDVQMPQYDGFEVLEKLAPEERPFVIFVTAYEQHAIRAFEISAVDYLLKPYSDGRFAAALCRAKKSIRREAGNALTQRVEDLLKYVQRINGIDSPPPPLELPPSGSPPPPETADRIVLKVDGSLHFVKTHEVLWLEAQGDFVKVQTTGKPQMVRETLQSFERKLDRTKFCRIHRSFLVNLEHVKRVETALYGDYSVYMSDGTKLRLSRSYRGRLKSLM